MGYNNNDTVTILRYIESSDIALNIQQYSGIIEACGAIIKNIQNSP